MREYCCYVLLYVWIWVVDVRKEDNEVFGYTKGV